MNESVQQDAVSSLHAFLTSDPVLRGAEADQDHARQMIAAPELPPSVETVATAAILDSIRAVYGAENMDRAFIYGDAAALGSENSCELVSYQGLLSGGVSACVAPSSKTVIAIWLNVEG